MKDKELNNPSVSEENKLVLSEGKEQDTSLSVLPILNLDLSSFTSPFNLSDETIEIETGDNLIIKCMFLSDITGSVQYIEGSTVYLDSGWHWNEEEKNRVAHNGVDTRIITQIQKLMGATNEKQD